MTFHIITIFPEIFGSYFNEGILKRAQKERKIKIKIYNLRDFAEDKHKTVDDTPYGGGPGMVLKIEPIWRCVQFIKSKIKSQKSKARILLTSAKGKEYTQQKAENLKKYSDVIIICGRYEGVDERVARHIADEEISIGRYVLTGGELPAMVIVDSVARLFPEVLRNKESLASESHSELRIADLGSQVDNNKNEKTNSSIIGHQRSIQKDYPVYTRPEKFRGWKTPKVLLSGNHGEIEKWRKKWQNKK